MSTKPNHRRGEARRQDHGPTYESHTPAAGCNSTHVARSRSKWKTRLHKALRRTGGISKARVGPGIRGMLPPKIEPEDS